MTPETYDQLHNLSARAQDPEFARELETVLDLVVEEERANFSEGVETFTQHARKLRQQVKDAFIDFYTKYVNGFRVLCETLDILNLPSPQITQENLKNFESLDQFREHISEGTSICQLLGFSAETLKNFFLAACKLLDEKQYEKARDAFYFLTTVAPSVGRFWLGLGISLAHLHETEDALFASLQAVELDPKTPGGYVNCLHLYMKRQEFDKANSLCEQGLAFASEHSHEPWAQKLSTLLRNATQQIKTKIF